MEVFTVLGGLALFIFGMNHLTEGLRNCAGDSLRRILAKATRSRLNGWVWEPSSERSSKAAPQPLCWSDSSTPD